MDKDMAQQYEQFAWQGGYAAFSVSESVIEKTVDYVNRQKEHHQKTTFKDEYIQFLKMYNVDYDDRYVFTD